MLVLCIVYGHTFLVFFFHSFSRLLTCLSQQQRLLR
uniref:Uncharacterized protein n=1 Tax=Arundo donax TaxID=35708 RepID=A0A0A9FB17_ARUDO